MKQNFSRFLPYPALTNLTNKYFCLFFFSFRTVVNDHTWKQIGAGFAAGALWGFVLWIITRWIINYFCLEWLESWKFCRIFFKNDYDPAFERSHWKGEKYRQRRMKKNNGVMPVDKVRRTVHSYSISYTILTINIYESVIEWVVCVCVSDSNSHS